MVHHYLSLVTIGCPQQALIQWMIIGNLKFEAYFELLDPLQLVDNLITSNINHCLSLVTIGGPQQPLIQWVIIGNLMFKAYFELLDPLQLVDILRTSMIHPCLSLVTIGCCQQPLIQWVIIGNLKFEEYFWHLIPIMGGSLSLNFKIPSLFVLGYHWLSLATIDLVGDNREFEVRGIF